MCLEVCDTDRLLPLSKEQERREQEEYWKWIPQINKLRKRDQNKSNIERHEDSSILKLPRMPPQELLEPRLSLFDIERHLVAPNPEQWEEVKRDTERHDRNERVSEHREDDTQRNQNTHRADPQKFSRLPPRKLLFELLPHSRKTLLHGYSFARPLVRGCWFTFKKNLYLGTYRASQSKARPEVSPQHG